MQAQDCSTEGFIAKAGKWYKMLLINIPLGFMDSSQTKKKIFVTVLVHH